MSIAQLEALISTRKSKLSSLYQRREQVKKQLAAIEAEIAAAEGSVAGRGRPAHFARAKGADKRRPPVEKAQNAKSLKRYVEEVLATNKKGLTIGEIQEAVLKSGYITNSANFKNTLYQCLYHNEKSFTLDKKTKAYKVSGK